MAKTIASLNDGRVVPWYSDDPIPNGFVDVPGDLLAKFLAGEIEDGIALAKAALANEVSEPVKTVAARRRTRTAAESAAPAEPVAPTEPSMPPVTSVPELGKTRA